MFWTWSLDVFPRMHPTNIDPENQSFLAESSLPSPYFGHAILVGGGKFGELQSWMPTFIGLVYR